MSNRRLLALFIVALLSMLALLLLPLRAALRYMDAGSRSISAIDATGTIWSGRLRNASWRGHRLGDVSMALQPLSLLVGVRRVELVSTRLSGDVLDGRVYGIEQVYGEIVLDRLQAIPGLHLTIRMRDLAATFSQGRCRDAGGRVTVEARLAGLDTLLQLQGQPTCDRQDVVLALASTGHPRAKVTLRVDAQGRYRMHTALQVDDASAAAGLQLAGFVRGSEGWSRTHSGRLSG